MLLHGKFMSSRACSWWFLCHTGVIWLSGMVVKGWWLNNVILVVFTTSMILWVHDSVLLFNLRRLISYFGKTLIKAIFFSTFLNLIKHWHCNIAFIVLMITIPKWVVGQKISGSKMYSNHVFFFCNKVEWEVVLSPVCWKSFDQELFFSSPMWEQNQKLRWYK